MLIGDSENMSMQSSMADIQIVKNSISERKKIDSQDKIVAGENSLPQIEILSRGSEEDESSDHSDSEAYEIFKKLQSRHNLFGEDEDDQEDEADNHLSEDQISNDSFTREFY